MASSNRDDCVVDYKTHDVLRIVREKLGMMPSAKEVFAVLRDVSGASPELLEAGRRAWSRATKTPTSRLSRQRVRQALGSLYQRVVRDRVVLYADEESDEEMEASDSDEGMEDEEDEGEYEEEDDDEEDQDMDVEEDESGGRARQAASGFPFVAVSANMVRLRRSMTDVRSLWGSLLPLEFAWSDSLLAWDEVTQGKAQSDRCVVVVQGAVPKRPWTLPESFAWQPERFETGFAVLEVLDGHVLFRFFAGESEVTRLVNHLASLNGAWLYNDCAPLQVASGFPNCAPLPPARGGVSAERFSEVVMAMMLPPQVEVDAEVAGADSAYESERLKWWDPFELTAASFARYAFAQLTGCDSSELDEFGE